MPSITGCGSCSSEFNAMSTSLRIGLLVFDFDGVLTDNRVLVMEDGTEAVFCSRADGLAFDALRQHGLRTLILSTETNRVVQARATKLRVEALQAIRDKAAALREYCAARNIALTDVAFVGNDLNDLPVMKIVGHPIAVADAHPAVLRVARHVLKTVGGHGVAREIVEELFQLSMNGI